MRRILVCLAAVLAVATAGTLGTATCGTDAAAEDADRGRHRRRRRHGRPAGHADGDRRPPQGGNAVDAAVAAAATLGVIEPFCRASAAAASWSSTSPRATAS